MESIVMRRGAVTNVFAPDLICIYLFIPLVLLQDRFMEHRPWSLNCNVSLSVKHQNSEDQGKYYSVSKGSISSSILCPWGWCWSYRWETAALGPHHMRCSAHYAAALQGWGIHKVRVQIYAWSWAEWTAHSFPGFGGNEPFHHIDFLSTWKRALSATGIWVWLWQICPWSGPLSRDLSRRSLLVIGEERSNR